MKMLKNVQNVWLCEIEASNAAVLSAHCLSAKFTAVTVLAGRASQLIAAARRLALSKAQSPFQPWPMLHRCPWWQHSQWILAGLAKGFLGDPNQSVSYTWCRPLPCWYQSLGSLLKSLACISVWWLDSDNSQWCTVMLYPWCGRCTRESGHCGHCTRPGQLVWFRSTTEVRRSEFRRRHTQSWASAFPECPGKGSRPLMQWSDGDTILDRQGDQSTGPWLRSHCWTGRRHFHSVTHVHYKTA